MQTQQNLTPVSLKLIEYVFFCINCCAIYSLYKASTKDYNIFVLLLVCVELLISAPKIIAFLPRPFECKKLPFESKPMP